MCQLNFNKRRRKSSLMPDFKNLITNENKQAEDSRKQLRKRGKKNTLEKITEVKKNILRTKESFKQQNTETGSKNLRPNNNTRQIRCFTKLVIR